MTELPLGTVPAEAGWLPDTMKALVIRADREGEPKTAMRTEDVPVPPIGPLDVLVLVMAAGLNYTGVWAARGEPISVMRGTGDDFHIAGDDAAGIVWRVGSEVKGWKPGDEVVVHPNQSCGQCVACNGLDPLACEQQKIWGYDTNWGGFAQFTRVQSQQLLPKPKHLSWEEAGSYGLTLFTAYRMLIDQAKLRSGDNVLVWGAGGGLGVFATQLCALHGANAIGVVSSDAKAELVRGLGAKGVIDRRQFDIARKPDETLEGTAARAKETRRFRTAIRELTGSADPDIVFEHVGAETFPTSVLVAKKFGTIVICGATTGYDLSFDVRYLWVMQKRIIGSHLANAYESSRANQLVIERKIQPVVGGVFPFEQGAEAHQLMYENRHQGKLVLQVQAPR